MTVARDASPTGDAVATQKVTPEQRSALMEQTNRDLLETIRNNATTQYGTQAPSLSAFRDAVSAHGGSKDDVVFLADFRTHTPLSNYSCYKPFLDKFNVKPCKKEDVENLLAPGLPDFFAGSSSTTGTTPKLLVRRSKPGAVIPRRSVFYANEKNPLGAVVFCGCMGVRKVEDSSGQVVQKIPIYLSSGERMRKLFGWELDDDEGRLSAIMPYYAVPWAATVITHIPSFLTVHSLFFLLRRNIDRIHVPFASPFIDFIHHIDKHWDMLIFCIRGGIIPDLEGIDDVRVYLQAQIHANPERAAELLEIGPPLSIEGWATRVWPELRVLCTVCTGPWSLMLPKVRFVLGPGISIISRGYGASEALIGIPHDTNKPDEFVLPGGVVIEFLDISQAEAVENLCQPWEVEVGKQYEPVITTKSGFWRYQLDDIVTIIGFHAERHSPIFKYLGRKSMKIHLPHAQIADYQLLEAIKANNSEDGIIVQEFTAVIDDRESPSTVGFIFELAKPFGPNAHLAPRKLFDALVSTDGEHLRALEDGRFRLPTIRIVKSGTFFEYRLWRATKINISFTQTKTPLVLVDRTMQEWFLERVVQEL